MKRIAVLTGTRAEYGLLRPIMRRIQDDKELELQLIVTGSHLSRRFGYTVKQIQMDGFDVRSRIPISNNDDSGFGMVRSLSKAILGISKAFLRMKPDIILLLGDRFETLAACLAASYMNIAIAHIHGGDISGSVDQPVRYAISQLSHLHFVSTPNAAKRIRRIGEERWRIFVVGAPGLEDIPARNSSSSQKVIDEYNIMTGRPFAILLQHPVVTELEQAESQIEETLAAISELEIRTLVIFPNSDAGGRRMIKVINAYARRYPFMSAIANVPRQDFLVLMSIADIIIGNSSSGIIEAPSFHLPAINIGTRQKGRERGANVIDVIDYDRNAIKRAIKSALHDKKLHKKILVSKNPYDKGNASVEIVKVLKRMELDDRLLQKSIRI